MSSEIQVWPWKAIGGGGKQCGTTLEGRPVISDNPAFSFWWVWAIYFSSQSLITSSIPERDKMYPTKEEDLRIK